MKHIQVTILVLLCLATALFSQTTWTSRVSGTTNTLYRISFGNNLYVAVGDLGTITTSPDGITWTGRTSGTTSLLYDITYGNSLYVAVGTNGTILTSPDGIIWTLRTSGTTTAFYGVTYGNNQYVAVNTAGTIYTSPDGVTWTLRTSGTTNALWGVAFGNNVYVAVSNTGAIYTSPDAITWTSRTSGTTGSLWGIVYGSNQFVVASPTGVILTSPNGITWTTRTTGATFGIYDVTYGNNLYVTSGGSGTILTSPDGSAWTTKTTVTSNNLNGAAYGNKLFVAVGSNGTILTSFDPQATSAFASDNSVRQAGIDADDYVKIGFDKAFTTTPAVSSVTIDTLFHLSGNHSWLSVFGTIGNAVWNTAKDTVTITFNLTGGLPTIAAGDTITYQGKTVVLSGSFDPLPRLKTALASDSLADIDGIDKDDYVRITFDTAFINVPVITASTINTLFKLNNSHTWLSGSGLITGTVWNAAKNSIRITLDTTGGLPTVAVGDTISYFGSKIVITGTFTSPIKLVSAVASDNVVNKIGIDADDYVLLSFTKAFAVAPTVTSANINSLFPLSKSHTWLSGNGTTRSIQWNPALNKLVVYLDTALTVPTVVVGDTVSYNGVKVVITGSFSTTATIAAPRADYKNVVARGTTMQIYTLQGKLVAQKVIETENCFSGKSNLYQNLSKGMYIVRIPTNNAVISRRVLVE